MLKNHFIIAWRIIARQKMYSAIKIGGFALGIAACLLISLFIRDELSYDQHYQRKNRIYRGVIEVTDKGTISKDASFSAPFAKTLMADFPEVEKAARVNASELFGVGNAEVRRSDKTENAHEEGVAYADPELLEILEISLVYGDSKRALQEPNTIVISKSKADKYFPKENPVGKRLILNNNESKPYTIAGVMDNQPEKSHLPYHFFLTLKGMEFWPGEQTNWVASNYATYILLREGANPTQLSKKLKRLTEIYIGPGLKQMGLTSALPLLNTMQYYLQPVTDIHLKSDGIGDKLNHGDIRFVWLFGIIAVFILVIAGINFINLSTAKSANRAKEVGIRKVLGIYRSNLVQQFLTESLVFSYLSFALGFGLAYFLLPYFNILAGKSLSMPWQEWWLLPTLAAAAAVIGLLAGLYPAFYLSAFKPISVLKGQVSRGSRSTGTRSFLVVFQFTISIILIVGTVIIYRQMSFILNKNIGYNKDQVIMLQGTNTLGDKVKTLKTELLRLPEVKSVSVSDYLPVKGTKRNNSSFWKAGIAQTESTITGQIWQVDHDYVKTMGMKIVAGRDFSTEMATDSQGVIINQAMAKELGFKNPVGQRITTFGPVWRVLGVVEDFHFDTFKENIRPLALIIGHSPSIISVKVNSRNLADLMQSVTGVWRSVSPHQPIRYTFLDESYAKMYDDVQRMGRIFSIFAILAIIVACLGLFALSAFMVEQRSKEISIRLVLGASGYSIFRLLTQNFLKLVFISLVIAAPIAWYLMQKWLQDYEYRISISWDVFLLAGVVVILVAVLTISYQSVQAAFTKPVNGLRSE